jgi:methylated-DNA-[protein]-cysteine S-methyltransferase
MTESNGGTCFYSVVKSPIGELVLTSDGEALTGLHMPLRQGRPLAPPQAGWKRDEKALREPREQLRQYFAGERRVFDLPLRMAGTPFQRMVWQGLLEIPFGATWSYAELARHVGRPGSSRAVGAANGRNPIGIVVPCHRVIGSDGTLTGYGGGVDRKEFLLEHEASVLGGAASVRRVGAGREARASGAFGAARPLTPDLG